MIGLVDLPSDIVRQIVRTDHPSIQTMRLISPRWNSLVIEYLSDSKNRKLFPKIEWFFCGISPYGMGSLRIRIPNDLRNYFGIEKWEAERLEDTENIVEAISTIIFKEDEMDCLLRLFHRCSHIEKFELTVNMIMNDEFATEINTISKIMAVLSLKELRVTGLDCIDETTMRVISALIEDMISPVLDMVCGVTVHRLVLTTDRFDLKTNNFCHNPQAVNLIRKALSTLAELKFEIDFTNSPDRRILTQALTCAANLVVQTNRIGFASAEIDRKDFCVSATFAALEPATTM